MSNTPGLLRSLREGQMDFVGQDKAQRFFTIAMWVGGLVGFVYGFLTESFLNSFMIIFAVFIICGLICVPSWPYFNQNRLSFGKTAYAGKKD